MPDYRRFRVEGGIYFFTLVTYKRRPVFKTKIARNLFLTVWHDVKSRFPFETVAFCLLPDHLHCIWKLPEGDDNYSVRWKEIKRLFSREYMNTFSPSKELNVSRLKRGEAPIWQRRFWEHTILDEYDLEEHLDYIHYNPIKHGYVTRAADWKWSTFQRYVNEGIYDNDWIGGSEGRLQGLNWEE